VEFMIRPEPDSEEREALALALERLMSADEVPLSYRSRWRAAGIAENLGGDDQVPEARGLGDRTAAE
jgi:hypothetical protein